MTWRSGHLAVDWGTTNRRAYLIGPAGIIDSFEDDQGVMSIAGGGFAQAVAGVRERLGDLPVLLGGMVGSNRGWREAPYVECPAGVSELAKNLLWIDDRTGIVPGVCQRGAGPDVMRGEEVQILGAVATERIGSDALVCHPGTHAKWIAVQDGQIRAFRTMMTGEIFGLLASHSILAGLMAGTAAVGAAFRDGVTEALAGEPPLSALFRLRARYLLEGEANDVVSRASGILIGSEVASALREFGRTEVALIGRPELCELYAEALRMAGQDSLSVDGADAFLGGIADIVRILE